MKSDNYESKIKPYLKDIREYVAHGVTEGQLCKFYGVGRTAWAEYKKTYSELTETLLRAREVQKAELVNRAFQIAMGYEYTESTTVEYYKYDSEGKKMPTGGKTTTVQRYAKADGGMAMFLLLNRFPQDYAKDPQVLELRQKLYELTKQRTGGGSLEGI